MTRARNAAPAAAEDGAETSETAAEAVTRAASTTARATTPRRTLPIEPTPASVTLRCSYPRCTVKESVLLGELHTYSENEAELSLPTGWTHQTRDGKLYLGCPTHTFAELPPVFTMAVRPVEERDA